MLRAGLRVGIDVQRDCTPPPRADPGLDLCHGYWFADWHITANVVTSLLQTPLHPVRESA
jgi:hypothetical protein